MTRFSVLALPLALLAGGCAGGNSDPSREDPTGDPAQETVVARLDDGVQVADVTVDGDTFRPVAIRLRAGVPARLVFTRTEAPTCADSISAPDLGVATTALPIGVPVDVEFTPSNEGDYTLACGMDMLSARLVVQS